MYSRSGSSGLKTCQHNRGKIREVYVLDWGLAKVLGGKSLAINLGDEEPADDLVSHVAAGSLRNTPLYDL